MDKMVLIDLETQDFHVQTGIYEVACLAVEKYEIVDRLYLAKEIPGYKGRKKYGFGFYNISRDALYINKFKEFMQKYPYPIVAHNCSFDRKFLVYYEWLPADYPAYCSIKAIKGADSSLDSYALDYLVRYFNVAGQADHTAMSDIENLYRILKIVQPRTWIPLGTGDLRYYMPRIKPRPLDEIDLAIDTTDRLKDEVICFTGSSRYPRHTMQEIAIKNGARVVNNITAGTTLLVTGLDPGPKKLAQAREKGIPVIADRDFLAMLDLADRDILA
ncbi:MAG TPA: 3'-5' exonuclease [Clostridia bacterium]|nr:3'-5' exonuclease [Clostridia bacterium]